MLKGNNGVAKAFFVYPLCLFTTILRVFTHTFTKTYTKKYFQGELIHHSIYDKALCLLCFGGVSTFDKVSAMWFMITVFPSTFS